MKMGSLLLTTIVHIGVTLFQATLVQAGTEYKLDEAETAFVTATIADVLREHIDKEGISFDISPEEARFSEAVPNKCQDQTKCGCRVESRNVQIFAAITSSSVFSANKQLFQDEGIILGEYWWIHDSNYVCLLKRFWLMLKLELLESLELS